MQKNRLNKPVRIAFGISEAVSFSGRAVVVDLFRFSATLCALLFSGRDDVRIYSEPRLALQTSLSEKGTDLFSELALENPGRSDNSPFLALKSGNPGKPAIVVTRSGTPAVMALGQAKEILVGCFSNLPVLARQCRAYPEDTLIVPACIFHNREHVEDFICAESICDALNGKDSFENALLEIHKSGRILDFLSARPENGRKDLEIILKKGNLPVLPRAEISGVFARAKAVAA